MSIMGIILFVLFGLIVGLLARAILPGRQHLSLVWTAVLGMAGSIVGAFVVRLFSGVEAGRFEPLGFIGSLIGAVALLALYTFVVRRRVRT